MARSKSLEPPQRSSRTDGTRRRVLEAVERLLREGADFSMRELATEAGVSFATPFNLFGSKVGVMHTISAQRIDEMGERFTDAAPTGDAAARVLAAVEIAADVMLQSPEVNRAVIGTLGAPNSEPGRVYRQSRALWAQALGRADGIEPALAKVAEAVLPDQLAIAFRGVLSFWTAGELKDAALTANARATATTLLLGFVTEERRRSLLADLIAPNVSPTTGLGPMD